MRRLFAFLDPLLRRAALVVEPHHRPAWQRHARHDKSDAREEFALVMFHLGDNSSGPDQALRQSPAPASCSTLARTGSRKCPDSPAVLVPLLGTGNFAALPCGARCPCPLFTLGRASLRSPAARMSCCRKLLESKLSAAAGVAAAPVCRIPRAGRLAAATLRDQMRFEQKRVRAEVSTSPLPPSLCQQCQIVRSGGLLHLGCRQVRILRQVQARRPLLDAAQH